MEDALGRCLDSVCWFMGWPIGHAFVVSDEAPPRLRSASWRLADPKRFEGLRKATDAIEFRPGFGLPGMVAASGKPSWIIDVRKEPGFIRAGVAEDLGVRSSFSFPVVIDAEVVAVLEFFSDLLEEPDEEALGVMAHVGEQLGQVLGRKRSEQTIAQAEARLAEAQRIAHLGSWVWDVTNNTVTCSQELIRLLRLEGGGLERTYDEFLSGILPEEATWLRELMTMNAQDPRPLDLEVHGLGPEGELRDFYLRGRAVRSVTGGPTKMIGTLQDITNRTLAERELEGALAAEREAQARLRAVDSMKSTLLHAVAHDLRSPLASILASVSVLQKDGTGATEMGQRLLDGLAYEGRKMDRLLGDLLDLDRIEAGILEPNRQPTDLRRLVRRVVAETRGLSARKVTVSVPEVVADLEESKVERILENLLRNLVAHTPPGTPVWITVGSDDAGVTLSVEDAGPGVPDEIKEAIFMPFNRGARGAENTEGFGIGLSLVARFAELHGGKAWVEDRAGGGASFRVLLPCAFPTARRGPGRESEALSPEMEAR